MGMNVVPPARPAARANLRNFFSSLCPKRQNKVTPSANRRTTGVHFPTGITLQVAVVPAMIANSLESAETVHCSLYNFAEGCFCPTALRLNGREPLLLPADQKDTERVLRSSRDPGRRPCFPERGLTGAEPQARSPNESDS